MSHKIFRPIVVLMLVIGLVVVVQAPHSAHAAGPWYVVTTGDDNNDCLSPSTPCATINGAIGKATDGDTIEVAAGTYTGSSNIVVFINKNLTISGGWDSSFVHQNSYSIIDSQMAFRIGVYISGLPVKTVYLDRFIIANGLRSGVENNGILTISNSTIHNNSYLTEGSGGGIRNNNNLSLINVTISNNSAGRGGGISSYGSISLNNTTITNNSAIYDGGGIYYPIGISSLINTIIAGNVVTGQNSSNDCYGPLSSSGYNLIGDISECIITLTSSDQANVNPLLGPLQDNGGFTLTHALLAGSPAIDAGNDASCASTDQRGVARPQGVACDIGAFELEIVLIDVSIDIKPGSETNPINTKSMGTIPVSILSTVDFDAPAMVDTTSLTFGNTGDETSLAFCNNEDVNEDGLTDLVCHFYTKSTGFQVGDTEGILKGQTVDGIPIAGIDNVIILK